MKDGVVKIKIDELIENLKQAQQYGDTEVFISYGDIAHRTGNHVTIRGEDSNLIVYSTERQM